MLRWSSDKAKRLTQVTEDSTPWTPQFDRAGNMTHAPKLAVDGHPEYDYAYDLLNWLTSVTRSSDDELVATFAYDALGRRIEHVNAVLGTTTRYYYDGANEIVETDESDNRLRWYVHGLSYIDERLMMFSEALGLPYYYAIDKDYSVRALVDKTGAIIERYCYDPYGNPLIRDSAGRGDLFNSSLPYDDNGLRFAAAKDACTSGCIWDPRADIDADGDVDGDDQDAYDALVSTWNGGPTVAQAFSGVGNPFAFQGRPHFVMDTASDAQTATVQLLDHRNRFLDPVLGRWLTRDPIGYADGMNLYEDVCSNPTFWLDPFGLAGEPQWRLETGHVSPGGANPLNPNGWHFQLGNERWDARTLLGIKQSGQVPAQLSMKQLEALRQAGLLDKARGLFPEGELDRAIREAIERIERGLEEEASEAIKRQLLKAAEEGAGEVELRTLSRQAAKTVFRNIARAAGPLLLLYFFAEDVKAKGFTYAAYNNITPIPMDVMNRIYRAALDGFAREMNRRAEYARDRAREGAAVGQGAATKEEAEDWFRRDNRCDY